MKKYMIDWLKRMITQLYEGANDLKGRFLQGGENEW
jgi:hypothetical protein